MVSFLLHYYDKYGIMFHLHYGLEGLDLLGPRNPDCHE